MAIKEVGQNASEISSKAVSETAPTNGQVLKYNSTSGEWEPGAETDTDTQLTQEQVEDYVNGLIVAGSNVTKTYDDAAGTLTIASTGGGAALDGIDDQSSSNDDQITITDTEVVINDDSDDLDFRVESDGSANMLFVDAGNSKVGIKTDAPISLLDINAGSADDVEAFSVSEGPTTRFRMIADFNPSSNLLHFAGHNNRTMMTFDTDGGSDDITGGLVGFGLDPSTAGEKISVDGAVSLKEQSSAPSATADYAKLYSTGSGADASLMIQNGSGAVINIREQTARAWVHLDMVNTAIDESLNVSGYVDNGTGDWTINFTTALPNANYAGSATSQGVDYDAVLTDFATGSFSLEGSLSQTAGSPRDVEHCTAIIVGGD
ncbi:MAG: hypothetical protein GY922_12060 [Proteobacteria bacterium]|nr:hypothetical protein [Pseudomonadota bacterium]